MLLIPAGTIWKGILVAHTFSFWNDMLCILYSCHKVSFKRPFLIVCLAPQLERPIYNSSNFETILNSLLASAENQILDFLILQVKYDEQWRMLKGALLSSRAYIYR